MFKANRDRVDWYLERKLAKIIYNDEPFSIQLTFEPKGLGCYDDPYYLQEMLNRCCVCGGKHGLTLHHVLPWCYKRHFPPDIKAHYSHDVLCLCSKCHNKYERRATELKKKLVVEYDAPVHGTGFVPGFEDYRKAVKAAKTLLKYRSQIPPERQEYLRGSIIKHLKREPTSEEILRMSAVSANLSGYFSADHKSHSEIVVEKLIASHTIQQFIEMWRTHFLSTMKPKFLPELWDVYRSVNRVEYKRKRKDTQVRNRRLRAKPIDIIT